jgi:hypothetical protein
MRRCPALVVVGMVLVATGVLRAQNQPAPAAPNSPNYPAWAYAISPPAPAAAPGAAAAQPPADTSL